MVQGVGVTLRQAQGEHGEPVEPSAKGSGLPLSGAFRPHLYKVGLSAVEWVNGNITKSPVLYWADKKCHSQFPYIQSLKK